MISLPDKKNAITTDEESFWTRIKEFILYCIGLEKNSRPRKLISLGGQYLVEELADEANASPDGYATVKVPFSFLAGPPTYITVVKDLQLARAIGVYGATDSKGRLPFYITDMIMRGRNIVSRNDPHVKGDRSEMKTVMHDFERINQVISTHFSDFLFKIKGVEHNIKEELRDLTTKVIGEAIIGIHNFPLGDDFKRMMSLLDELDEAMTLLDTKAIKRLGDEIFPYSKWIYDNNKETLLGENSVTPHLVGEDLEGINVVNLFLITPNIVKLIYLSIIYLGYNPGWQEKLRIALKHNDEKFLSNMYKELCRLFIPTNIPRYASRETNFRGHTFPKGTMFFILGRAIRLDPKIYPDPLEFKPERFSNKNIAMNSIELCPFGFGPRQCPASSQFTEKFWLGVMRTIFLQEKCKVDITSPNEMEAIPSNIRHLSLEETYTGLFL